MRLRCIAGQLNLPSSRAIKSTSVQKNPILQKIVTTEDCRDAGEIAADPARHPLKAN